MMLIKMKSGFYTPSDSESQEASKMVKVGTEVEAVISRNPDHLRKFMALIKLGFDSQERFTNINHYRYELMIRAGFCTEEHGKFYPESIAFKNMGQEKFNKVYTMVLDTIASDIGTESEAIKKEVENFY